MAESGPRARRVLFEMRTGEGASTASNSREAIVCENDDVVLSGDDSDPELEKFTGSTSWQGELRVEAGQVPLLRAMLERAFGPPKARNRDEAILELIDRGFGGKLSCMTRFGEWLSSQSIPHSEQSW